MVLADAMGLEFSAYRHLKKHFLAKLSGEEEAVISNSRKLVNTLNALCIEMDNRYDLMKQAGTKNILEYNTKFIHRKLNPQQGHQYLPDLLLIIDDLGQFVYSDNNKEIYLPIDRMNTNGKAVGLRMIISTSQFLNPVSKNLSSIIGNKVVFRLNNREDYRKYLDTSRVDKHLKAGEFLYNESGRIFEGHTFSTTTENIQNIVEDIACQRGYPQAFLLPEYIDEKDLEGKDFDSGNKDPLFEDAARLIVQNQVGSTSLLQRRMKLGYNRAGRLMEQLEAAGIVGPSEGSKARVVLIKSEADLNVYLETFN